MPRNSRKRRQQTVFVDDCSDEGDKLTTVGYSDTVSAGGRSVTRSKVVHVTPRSPAKAARKDGYEADSDTMGPSGSGLGDLPPDFDEGHVYQIQSSDAATVPRRARKNNYFQATVSIVKHCYSMALMFTLAGTRRVPHGVAGREAAVLRGVAEVRGHVWRRPRVCQMWI